MHTDTDPAQLDGYRRLLVAIVAQAWKDARRGSGRTRAAAVAWLHSDGAAASCDWLEVDVGILRERLGAKKATERQNV